jgi:hypothetical protein
LVSAIALAVVHYCTPAAHPSTAEMPAHLAKQAAGAAAGLLGAIVAGRHAAGALDDADVSAAVGALQRNDQCKGCDATPWCTVVR